MKLRDGRWVQVREYGDPAGYPVVHNHGGLMCGRDVAPADSAARDLGVRLIAIDRPGVGSSSRSPGRITADWAGDVEEVLTARGVTQFSALGWSLGGQYALALHRAAASIVLVAPSLPLTGAWLQEVNTTDRALVRASMRAPLAARVLLRAMRTAGRLTTRTTERLVCADDERMLASLPQFTGWLKEGLAQPAGVVDEYRTTALDWGFGLCDVCCPVTIWQGGHDNLVPPHWAEDFAEMLPDARIRRVPDAGHFVAYGRWADVLRDTLA